MVKILHTFVISYIYLGTRGVRYIILLKMWVKDVKLLGKLKQGVTLYLDDKTLCGFIRHANKFLGL